MPTFTPARARLLRRLLMLAAGAAVAFPTEASADDVRAGAGLYVSFVFGHTLGVGYGVEGNFLVPTDGNSSYGAQSGVGGLIQIGGINSSTLRLVGAAQAGGQLVYDGPGLAGELGVAGHVGENPGVGMHTGLVLDTLYWANLFFRSEIFLDEYSVGVGARFPGTFADPTVSMSVAGRPVRAEDGTAAPPDDPAIEPGGGDDLAEAWARDAMAECASISAFLQLALDLLACDAPEALVAAALDAAEDEARHARSCAAMASRWLRRPFRPHLPRVPLRVTHPGDDAIARLAVESWLDGGLGEGAAAARARVAASEATDLRAASVQRRIAADESRHAALGWRVLAWALARGDASVGERVRAQRDVELLAPERAQGVTARSATASRAMLDRALAPASRRAA